MIITTRWSDPIQENNDKVKSEFSRDPKQWRPSGSSWSRQRKTPTAHYLADVFVMHHGPRSIPLYIQHHIQLTFLSFQVSQPSHPDIQEFKYFTMKIKGQGHGWGERWKSKHGSNIISTDISFIPCQSAITFLRYNFFLNLTLKIQSYGHGWGPSWKLQKGCNILSTHILFVPRQSAIPFLRYNIFKIWPWKSKAKFMGELNVESHNMCPRSWLRSKLKVTKWV